MLYTQETRELTARIIYYSIFEDLSDAINSLRIPLIWSLCFTVSSLRLQWSLADKNHHFSMTIYFLLHLECSTAIDFCLLEVIYI